MGDLINWILNSGTDSLTIDTEIKAYAANIKLEKQVAYLAHKRWTPVETVKYDTYYTPTRSRAWVIWDGLWTGWNDTDTTSLPITSDTTKILDAGFVIKVESEIVVVKSVDRDNDTIDVYKRWAGWTTAAAHVDTTALTIHTVAVPEGMVIWDGLFREKEKNTNTIQLFEKRVRATYTDAKARRKSLEDHVEDMIQQQFEELRIDQDMAALYWYYDEGSADWTDPRMTRWLINSILEWGSSNLVNAASGAWTEDRMNATLKAIWKEGWTVDTIMMSIDNKVITNWFGSFQKRIEDTRWNVLWATNDAVAAEGIGNVFIAVDDNIKNIDVIYCNLDDMEVSEFMDDAIRIEDIENGNPRVVEKLIHWQEGFNYTNVNRNFALDTNLTT